VTNSFADVPISGNRRFPDITAQTGVSIIADNTVQGTITLDFENVLR